MNIHSGMGAAAASGDSPKREAILEAALALFAERGFHGTAVPEIAARAKVGAGTVYRYFESKEELVNELFRAWKTRLSEVMAKDVPTDLAPRALFHTVFLRFVVFAAEHPAAMAFLELHHHRNYLDRKSLAVEEAAKQPMREFIGALQRAKAVRDGPPDLLISILWGGFIGAVRASQRGDFQAKGKELELIEDCLWEAVRR